MLVGVAALGLASCASISEEACRAGDWESVGYRDGVEGRSPGYFLNHAQACNEIGIAPNRTVWQAGYAEGLKRYCTPFNAFEEGRSGNRLNNVCPAEDMRELRWENSRGYEWYRLGREIDENERRIREINALLADLPDGHPARTQLVSERSILRLETLRLRWRRAAIRY